MPPVQIPPRAAPFFLWKKAVLGVVTLGAHAQRGYCSWVCLCVCLSVTLNLTSRVFVRLTKDMPYFTGNEGQKFRTVFSENALLGS